ncbi:ABC transporter permease [Campylobacter troglodytis]|uniref:ABC transporter permease n=1 Tax=Campylobacter troglodytis TaxID=654363 RepID=UPI00115BAED7|nr:FtsX-like permease family protein [Campylobacter troglodytis]TQR60980.1 hypothetical protein DMC01_03395 [Campylobacter troglodytis]
MVNSFLTRELFKSLIFSFRRVFIIILAIFIAALVSSAFLNIYFDIDTKLSKELKAYGANLNILSMQENENISNEAFERAKKELNTRGVTPYLYSFLNVDGAETLVLGTDFGSLRLTKPFIDVLEGSFSLSDFKADSAFIGKDLANKIISGNKQESLKSLIGRELELYGLDGEKAALKIKGILSSNDEFDTLFLAPLEVVQILSKQEGINYATGLVYGNYDDVSEVAARISDEELNAKPISSVSLSEGLVLDKLKALMFLIVLVVLIIASTSVNTTLSSIIFSRKKEIALHLALGARKADIAKLFGLECLVLALIASFLGIIFGYALANVFGWIIFNAGIDFRFKAAVLAVLISLVFAFFAAFFPIKKALNINVCDNLKGE